MKSKDSEGGKIAVRSLKKAGSIFEIKGLASSKHAIRLMEHFITSISCSSVEEIAEQRAHEIGDVLFRIGMIIHPGQFGPAAKASAEHGFASLGNTEQTVIDVHNSKEAMISLREIRSAERRMGLPEDYFIRRNADYSPHPAINSKSSLLFGSIENSVGGFRPPVIEPQRIDAYTFAEDPMKIMVRLVEAAGDQDLLDMRTLYEKPGGPSSIGAEVARKLCAALDRDQCFVSGEKQYLYKSPWAAICELLALVGCDFMTTEQVRQACSAST